VCSFLDFFFGLLDFLFFSVSDFFLGLAPLYVCEELCPGAPIWCFYPPFGAGPSGASVLLEIDGTFHPGPSGFGSVHFGNRRVEACDFRLSFRSDFLLKSMYS